MICHSELCLESVYSTYVKVEQEEGGICHPELDSKS